MQDIRTPRPTAYVVDPARPRRPIRHLKYAPNMGGGAPAEDRPGTGTSFVRCKRIPRADNPKLATWEARLSRFALARGCFFLKSAYELEGRLDLWKAWLEYHARIRVGKIPSKRVSVMIGTKSVDRFVPEPFPEDRLPIVVQKLMSGELTPFEVKAMEYPAPIIRTEHSEFDESGLEGLETEALQGGDNEDTEAENLARASGDEEYSAEGRDEFDIGDEE